MARIEAVIFDWGGTLAEYALVEFEQLWLRSARRLAPEREAEVAMHLAAVEEAFWERTASGDERSWTLADVLHEATRTLGGEVADAVRAEAAGLYLDAWEPHIRHDVEAVPVLKALRERGLRIGLLSNTHWPREYHERFLDRDGLTGLIDARVYSSEIAYMKPHRAAFEAAMGSLGITDASTVVFVGDRLYDDVLGAQGAGMRGVHRLNPAIPAMEDLDVRPDAVIATLGELVGVVDGWGGESPAP